MMQSTAFVHSWPIHDDYASDPLFQLPSPAPGSFDLPFPLSRLGGYLADDASTTDFDALEAILSSDQMEGIYDCLGLTTTTSQETWSFGSPSVQASSGVGQGWSPSSSLWTDERMCTVDDSLDSVTLTLPCEGMEIDGMLVLHHLLVGYGEAVDCGQNELVEVMARRIADKSNPLGRVHERLAYHLFRDCDGEGVYLEQESRKNFEAALALFYQVYPYGRFAHLAANCAILESIPSGTRTLRVVDLGLGEGIQWALMLESIARRCGEVKLTYVTHEGEDSTPHWYNFERTERLLLDQGRTCGVNLTVERVRIAQLADSLRGTRCAGEWTVFNCMSGLPHTARDTSRRTAVDFMSVAVEFLSDSVNYFGNRRGILVVGEGSPSGMPLGHSTSFGEFFEKCLNHYSSLLISMETKSLASLPEARIAMESLFVSPFISAQHWLQRWEEVRNGFGPELIENCAVLDGIPISRSNLMETQELIKETCGFDVKIAEKDNAIVLEYRGNPMARVSTWDCRPKKL
ncbi:hypothetical protein MLD38_029785 [Melastoma candidum]|uniref:Uncharacterized protein n=1 Tax=Melastoma candidum TaxID=119954 RepID=A0ACB9N5M2_9MYRT|nr:hypothetical protein MLD38_029785 [Melastoma candidum]